jgi:hypothetical protein
LIKQGLCGRYGRFVGLSQERIKAALNVEARGAPRRPLEMGFVVREEMVLCLEKMPDGMNPPGITRDKTLFSFVA